MSVLSSCWCSGTKQPLGARCLTKPSARRLRDLNREHGRSRTCRPKRNVVRVADAMSERDKKTAIITGGSRGIGYGIAECLARDGYDLVLGYNANHEAAERAQHNLQQEHGVKVFTVAGDAAAASTTHALFDCARDNFDNRVTAWISNAGLILGASTARSDIMPDHTDDPNHFEEMFDYHQKLYSYSFKRGMQLALQCEGFRHAVAISSPGCNANQTPKVAYEIPGQAKASLEFLVRIFARKLASQGINVNCIIPGYVATEAWQSTPIMQAISERVTTTPAGRWASPREIGDVVAFLCSKRAEFVTGVSLPVDGGLHLS